jgi:ribonuclease P protein component
LLVVHWVASSDEAGTSQPPRVGFVVSKQVGPAVVRSRVKRRLRHQVRARLARLSPGFVYVVRANPAASTASSDELGVALDSCLDQASR